MATKAENEKLDNVEQRVGRLEVRIDEVEEIKMPNPRYARDDVQPAQQGLQNFQSV